MGLFGSKKITPTLIQLSNGASFVLASKGISSRASAEEFTLTDDNLVIVGAYEGIQAANLASGAAAKLTQPTAVKQYGGIVVRGYKNGFVYFTYFKEIGGCTYSILVGGASPKKTDNDLEAIVSDFNATFRK